MIEVFHDHPIILLFIVAAIGYGVGNIKVRSGSLGVAAVLFVGLGFGALDETLYVPDFIILLGLAIFVYTIGLGSGPAFFSTFRRRGFQDIFFVFLMLTFSAGVTALLHHAFGFNATTSAGIFAGVTTNTPALAGLLDTIGQMARGEDLDLLREEAVIGYSLTYPMGVLGVMLAIYCMQRWLKIDYRQEEHALSKEYPVKDQITTRSVEVVNEAGIGMPLRDLKRRERWGVVFGRLIRGDETMLISWDTVFQRGDQVAVVGDRFELDRVVNFLGRELPYKLSDLPSDYEVRNLFVSNAKVAGERLATLNIAEQYAAIVTRVRRGDIDLLANGDTVLELGDQVRFVARKKDLPILARLFGNSYEALSHINLFSFGLGMALGLLLGLITFELPGGVSFKLGYAGGPLIVALALGALRRTGPVVWTLPYSANLTIRQFGLILLLAGIGIRSGHSFVDTIAQGGGGLIFLSGTIISCLSAFATLLIGYKVLKIPFSFLIGMVANQPAILEYSLGQARNKLPTVGFTLMLPVALITKIIYVQVLYALLQN